MFQKNKLLTLLTLLQLLEATASERHFARPKDHYTEKNKAGGLQYKQVKAAITLYKRARRTLKGISLLSRSLLEDRITLEAGYNIFYYEAEKEELKQKIPSIIENLKKLIVTQHNALKIKEYKNYENIDLEPYKVHAQQAREEISQAKSPSELETAANNLIKLRHKLSEIYNIGLGYQKLQEGYFNTMIECIDILDHTLKPKSPHKF